MATTTCFAASASTRICLQSFFPDRTTPFTSNCAFSIQKRHKLFSASLSPITCSSPPISASSASSFDLSPPPIDHDLLETVTADGAKVSEDGIIETFDNDDEALDAFDNGVVVLDLSHFGLIRVSGDDRIQFLHNQTTANFECRHDGQKNSIMLVVSPLTCENITQMLNKYIFFADKVEVEDITKKTSFFILAGPQSNQVMVNLNLGDLVGQPYGSHRHYSVNGMPITVGVGNILSEQGYSLLMSPGAAESVWKTLLSQGAIPMGSIAYEKLRIIQGIPAPGKELTSEFNVLEACLWNSISQNKGCYKGQETIAKLITYDGVKQRLWGLHLSAPAQPGSIITIDGKKVGKLTSYTSGRNKSEHFGLGYIKRNTVSEGSTVTVGGDITATVAETPFHAQQCPPSKKPSP